MDEHETREFLRRQAEAAQRMREMNARAAANTHRMPPMPSFVSSPARNQTNARGQNSQATERSRQNAPEKTRDTRDGRSGQAGTSVSRAVKRAGTDGLFGGINLPFSDILTSDSDISLIIGLLLLLYCENADRLLMCALIYILL